MVSEVAQKLGTPVSPQFHALVASPFDKVHRLLQTQGSNPKVLSGERAEYAGIVDCFRRVLARERNESNSGLASPSFSASFGKKTLNYYHVVCFFSWRILLFTDLRHSLNYLAFPGTY